MMKEEEGCAAAICKICKYWEKEIIIYNWKKEGDFR
jgi:hypothetical protein